MPLDHRAINLLIHLTKKWSWRAAAENTNWTKLGSETRYKKKIKKRTITLRLVFWISITKDSGMCSEKRRPLRSSKNQIDGALSRIFIHSHCKVQIRVVIIKEVAHVPRNKKNPWFRSHILSKTFEQNGNRINSLYWYKAIVRCKHLVARILQHGFKLSSWLKVNKISNQIVHHQSATLICIHAAGYKKITSLI